MGGGWEVAMGDDSGAVTEAELDSDVPTPSPACSLIPLPDQEGWGARNGTGPSRDATTSSLPTAHQSKTMVPLPLLAPCPVASLCLSSCLMASPWLSPPLLASPWA